MAVVCRFYHSSLSGKFFYTMLSRSFLVHHIMLTNRDFKEHIQPPFHLGHISEEELIQGRCQSRVRSIIFLRAGSFHTVLSYYVFWIFVVESSKLNVKVGELLVEKKKKRVTTTTYPVKSH
ncbi:hypothetical protein H5410_016739 [Solanum commersonii]|uniref:Uncharacterized protein n=1 Tax=Solanum commersonii TaxID=4109 RepID=A0A9J5ZXW7_SOLCO|nr:hypothetical protein H5410_016739 [Solanum commersonii]